MIDLEKYSNFEDCIIEDISFVNDLSTLEITFNYIYDSEGHVRKDLDKMKILVKLIFQPILSLTFENGLSKNQIENLSSLNWSQREIAIIQIEEVYRNGIDGFMSTISWEGDRQLKLFSKEIIID